MCGFSVSDLDKTANPLRDACMPCPLSGADEAPRRLHQGEGRPPCRPHQGEGRPPCRPHQPSPKIVASPLAEALQSPAAPTSTSSAAMESAPPQVSQVSHLKSLKSLISPPCRPHQGNADLRDSLKGTTKVTTRPHCGYRVREARAPLVYTNLVGGL